MESGVVGGHCQASSIQEPYQTVAVLDYKNLMQQSGHKVTDMNCILRMFVLIVPQIKEI